MIIRGNLHHIHTAELESKRGHTTLTSVWIVDNHDHSHPTKQSSTLYEVQYLNDKVHDWATAISDNFDIGDRLLALAGDDVETVTTTSADGETRSYIKARGHDLAWSALDEARTR